MSSIVEQLGLETPVFQAGMGGGLSTHRLAAAVSEAGGLGTLGILPPDLLRADLAAARELTGRPIAVNLLLPFARRAHRTVAAEADAVVTFWGKPERPGPKPWIHQCGSVDEALAAQRAGADAVIAQGVEAGGHVRGTQPAMDLLEATRAALPAEYPVLSAGGVTGGAEVRVRLDAGAAGVVSGTRFLMTEESDAHPDYKRRLVEGGETILTELFGAGWPGAHRVLPNRATERWLSKDVRGPRWMRAAHRATAPVLARVPQVIQDRALPSQSPGSPMLSPAPPSATAPANLLESGPLYAGECVARLHDLPPAAEVVRRLTP